MTPADFQQAFWHSLWRDPDQPASEPWVLQPGFAVYRNTVLKGCIDNLTALYPSVRRLAGEDWLQATALTYARQHPPSDGRMHDYGKGFTHFIAELLADSEWCWLPEVARLDRLWSESHVAADAASLQPAQLLARTQEKGHADAGSLRLALRPHPAARWHWCADWPAFSLWQAAREALADPNPPHWRGQGILLTRPHGTVLACELDRGACTFLDACARGNTIEEATARAQDDHSDHDLGATLQQLITQGALMATVP